jgi:hypothetical protein
MKRTYQKLNKQDNYLINNYKIVQVLMALQIMIVIIMTIFQSSKEILFYKVNVIRI